MNVLFYSCDLIIENVLKSMILEEQLLLTFYIQNIRLDIFLPSKQLNDLHCKTAMMGRIFQGNYIMFAMQPLIIMKRSAVSDYLKDYVFM